MSNMFVLFLCRKGISHYSGKSRKSTITEIRNIFIPRPVIPKNLKMRPKIRNYCIKPFKAADVKNFSNLIPKPKLQ